MSDEKNINLITSEIKKLIKEYNEEYGLYPYDINNGSCDEFAEEIVSRLSKNFNTKKNKIFVIEFYNIVDTGDDDWEYFYPECIESFNLNDTQGLDKNVFLNIIKEHGDETHAWICYEKNDGKMVNFDAETINGVDNPFKLKTYTKFIKAHNKEIKDRKNLENFLKEYKNKEIESSKKTYKLR